MLAAQINSPDFKESTTAKGEDETGRRSTAQAISPRRAPACSSTAMTSSWP
jgi:hypothetical protein